MRRIFIFLITVFAVSTLSAQTWVRVNQLGYLPTDLKVAVLISTEEADGSFEVFNAINDELVFKEIGRAHV